EVEGATVLLPGTVYNFGPDAFDLPDEDATQQPLTRKGAIRVALEARLQRATEGDSGVRAIVVRAGDFFGRGAGNNWFSQGLVVAGRVVKRVRTPGQIGVGHQCASLPDVARCMVLLLQRRDRLQPFARFHM